jgi:hypothetical protein
MTVGGDKPVYVDDVFAAVPYKGSDKATRWTPPLPIDAPTVTAYNSSAQFNDDGTLLFILNKPANYEIATLALPTPYSLEDAALIHSGDPTGGAESISGLPNGGFQFSPDGLTLAIRSSNNYYTVPLATAWDLTTAGTPSTVTSITGSDTRGFLVVPDGSGFITQLIGSSGDRTLDIYDMSVPWDFSTATLSRSQLKNRISNSYYYVAAWSASGYFTSCAATTGGAVIESHGKAAPYVLSTGTSTSWDNSDGSGHRNNSAQTVGILHLPDNRTWLEVMSDGSSYWRQQLNIENGTELGVATTPISSTVDLAERGGMSWHKRRDIAADYRIFDTERGNANFLECNTTDAEASTYQQYAEPLVGGGMGVTKEEGQLNNQAGEYINWQFAKQEGFFDVVTYTGNGVAGREIAHNLGSTPGMVIVRATNRDLNARDWMVYHRSLNGGTTPENYFIRMNLTNAESASSAAWNNTAPTAAAFTLGSSNDTNENGYEYVAYVFADDAPMFGPDGDESIIKCGSYTGNGSDNGPEIDLGWEPQWLLIKNTSSAEYWVMIDTMRGATAARGYDSVLYPNANDGEAEWRAVWPKATGFQINDSGSKWNTSNDNYIYMAIRRPNKPAKEFEPDELFAVEEATGSVLPQFKSGFPVDFAFRRSINGALDTDTSARLIQGTGLKTNTTAAAETNAGSAYFDFMNGWRDSGADSSTLLSWMWRRAPGFFDVVTYEGDGVDDKVIPHNLQAVPEMFWMKSLSTTGDWFAYNKDLPLGFGDNYSGYLSLNSTDQASVSSAIRMSGLTDESLMCSPQTGMNQLGVDYITYLFASVPGICDIGSYTGTGADRDIDCGFSNGARFVLIKRYEGQAGSWYYFDTVRGIVTRSSPTLYLNDTQAQATDPKTSISPLPAGFSLLNSLDGEATNYLNTTGHKYIYMAIA